MAKSITARKRSDRSTRMTSIMAAALQVFSEKGYANAAVAEIAARVGVVEGTVYKYFETKRGLLVKVLENWYRNLVEDYEAHLSGIVGTEPKLRYLVWRHLQAIKESPQLTHLMFREIRSEEEYFRSPLFEMNRRYTKLLTDTLQAGIEAGEIRSDLPLSLMRDAVYGCVEHHTWNFLCGRGKLDPERLSTEVVSLLCGGICPPARQASSLSAEVERLADIVDRLQASLSALSYRTPGAGPSRAAKRKKSQD